MEENSGVQDTSHTLFCPGSVMESPYFFFVLLLELVNHSDVGQFPNYFTCTTFTSTLEYDINTLLYAHCLGCFDVTAKNLILK